MPMVVNHRTVEDNDLERIVKVMLPTFRKFLNIDDLHKFYIISPKKDLEIIEKRLSKEFPEFPYEYVDELELLPQLKTFPLHKVTVHPGWMIQIMTKLEIAKRMETEYYMTHETDLFLTKLFSYENMFNGGKLIGSYYDDFDTPNCSTKWQWHLHATALVLPGIEEFYLHPDNDNEITEDGVLKINKVLGVSPQFFITKEINNLLNHLEETWKDEIKSIGESIGEDTNYLDLLLRCTNGHPNTWVEYTLYMMWLYKTNTFEKYYSFDPPYISSGNLWGSSYKHGYGEKYFNEFDTHIMENPNHYFNLIQSNIKDIKLDFVVEKLKKHVEI